MKHSKKGTKQSYKAMSNSYNAISPWTKMVMKESKDTDTPPFKNYYEKTRFGKSQPFKKLGN